MQQHNPVPENRLSPLNLGVTPNLATPIINVKKRRCLIHRLNTQQENSHRFVQRNAGEDEDAFLSVLHMQRPSALECISVKFPATASLCSEL